MSPPFGIRNPSRFKTGHNVVAILVISLVTSLSASGNIARNYFANMDKQFFDRIANRFEPSGSSRLDGTRLQLMEYFNQLPTNDTPTLRFVNDLFNLVPQVEDRAHWGTADYWATPAELVASNGGDCEDFVIAKYFALRESGIPAEKMRLTYVIKPVASKASYFCIRASRGAKESSHNVG